MVNMDIRKKAVIGFGAITALFGIFYAFLPHSIHISTELGFGLSHNAHRAIGVLFFALTVGIFYLGLKNENAAAETAPAEKKVKE